MIRVKRKYADTFMDTTPRRIEECDARQLEVLKIFSRYKFNRILDVGCADGNFSILLKEACNAREVYGIEVSEKGVKLTRKNGVKAFQLDIDEEDFPFEDNYFDAVFAGSVIEYLSDPDHLLEEVRRVLKLNLGLFITFPNLASLYNKILLLLGFQPFGMNVSLKYRVRKFGRSGETVLPGAGNIRYFTLRSLRELLKLHDFDIEIEEGIPWLNNFLDKISRFPSMSAGVILVSKVRKGENEKHSFDNLG